MTIPRFSGIYRIIGQEPIVRAIEATIGKQLDAQKAKHYSSSTYEGADPVIATTEFVVGEADMKRLGLAQERQLQIQNLSRSAMGLGFFKRALLFLPVMLCSMLLSAYNYLAQPFAYTYSADAMKKHLEKGTLDVATGKPIR